MTPVPPDVANILIGKQSIIQTYHDNWHDIIIYMKSHTRVSSNHRMISLIDIEGFPATISFQKGVQVNYILNINHSSILIESLISSYQQRPVKEVAFASPDVDVSSK
ncbi:hypothetical protein K501DRAFT_270592 [Backusella circina FSU 941]|nr:hypothetical protein K501DRAFT_270592 [Backusella circina FSU 941]